METLQPKLRFPEFKDNWKNKYFKEVYSFRSTNSLSRDKLNYENGLVKNIHYGDIHSKFNSLFKVCNEQVPYINNDISLDKIPNENYLKEKDLVIADASEDYNDIGKCLEIIDLNEQDVLAGLHTFIARPDLHDMALGFGNYLMKSDYSKIQIKTIAQGTKVLSISTTRLSEIKINIPSLEEQTRIANFLSSVDEKINLLKEKKALLEDYKKGIMQKIFNQEIRFKDDNGNDYVDWEQKTFGEMSTIRRGASPRPITDTKWFDENSTIGWVRISDVSKSNKYLLKTEQYLSEEGVNKSRLVTKGNLIMSICATIGKPIYTDFDVCIHDGFVVFENLKGYREYFYYYLQYIQKNWYNYGQPGTQVNLNSDIVSNELLLFPSIDEQTKIANFLSAIDEKIELVSNQIQDTQEYKKGLLQQMFV